LKTKKKVGFIFAIVFILQQGIIAKVIKKS